MNEELQDVNCECFQCSERRKLQTEINKLRTEARRLFDAHLAIAQAINCISVPRNSPESMDPDQALAEIETITLQAIQATSKAGLFKNQG